MKKWKMTEKDGYCLIYNEGGAVLGISVENKDAIIEVDGYAFKDLNRNGSLDPYEDWRLPVEERAADLAGKAEPSALLPFVMPKDMDTVEKHNEDMPFDIEPYQDECGNRYDFAYGLGWNGVIKDERTRKYRH